MNKTSFRAIVMAMAVGVVSAAGCAPAQETVNASTPPGPGAAGAATGAPGQGTPGTTVDSSADTDVLPPPSIVPIPAHVQVGAGRFALTSNTVILTPARSDEAAAIGHYLADRLAPATGWTLSVSADAGGTSSAAANPAAGSAIDLKLIPPREDLGDEGYTLQVTPQQVTIAAPHPAGLFYGVQTLRQLFPPDIEQSHLVNGVPWVIPAVTITDAPRFRWRGLLLDVSRHFRTKEFVERTIDQLAYHKMNVLHWHLTDDQGWRIEIKKYPKLTTVGAWRDDHGKPYGGFYTQDDIREIVAYARSRYVTIVPEIETPGHCTASLAAYPEHSCTGGPFTVPNHWGIFHDVYCPGKESTFTFLEDVLTEVMDLFPSTYIHVGGDEVPKDRWKACPDCQKRIKDEGLKDEEALQGYMMRRIDAFLVAHGRRSIGWDEILRGGLSPTAGVQSWHGLGAAVTAAKSGHDVVVSPTSHCYLDYPLSTTSLEKAYSLEPVPAELAPDQAAHILGLEGCMWGEAVPTPVDSDHHVFPRLCALAEVAWSPRETRNFDDFSQRLAVHLGRLQRQGVAIQDLGKVAGRWNPAQMSVQLKPVDWDVTRLVRQPGTFEVTLSYDGGADGIAIGSVTVLENGMEIAHDTHDGWTGAQSHDNTYSLTVPAIHAGATYTLRVHLRSDGGTDSRGTVWMKKE